MADDDGTYQLVMPLIVCQDNGGPYDGEAFVAGAYFGEATAAVRLMPIGMTWRRFVPARLVPQLDLLAMAERVHIRATPVEAPVAGEWVYVEMQPQPFEEEEADHG